MTNADGWRDYGIYKGWKLYRRNFSSTHYYYKATKEGFEGWNVFEETRNGIRELIKIIEKKHKAKGER